MDASHRSALILDAGGAPIDVHVFESADLPAHRPRLDEFEGTGYDRVTRPSPPRPATWRSSTLCTAAPRIEIY